MSLLAATATALLVGRLALALGRRPSRVPRPSRTPALLAEAGAPFGTATFVLVRLACAAAAFWLAVRATGAPVVALPPAAVAGAAPRWLLARRAAGRQLELQQAWPEALRELAASVAAGMSLPQALEALALSGPPPIRQLCDRLPVLLPAVGLAAALERVRARAADATTDRVVEVLLLAHERGGRVLPAILADLAEACARDLHLQERIATAQLELRLNARVVFALPWAVLCVLTARPGPFRAFYASARAVPIVALAAGLSLAGIVVVERLGKLPVEPRVFAGRRGATP